MSEQAAKHQAHPSANPLRNLNFFKLLSYRVCMVFSYQIMAVVVGWQECGAPLEPATPGAMAAAAARPPFGWGGVELGAGAGLAWR
jgi:hypothetical protein